MARKQLSSLDLTQNQLLNAALQNLGSAPGSPVVGQIYFDTTLTAVREWDGTAWTNKATDTLLLQGQNGAYYLSRANHTGTQVASTISNLQATVLAYTLDTFAAPAGPISMGGQRVTNVGAPTATTDGVNKAYVDAFVQGVENKPSAQVATIAALPTNTYSNGASGVGATLTASANGVLTVDGYAVAAGDRILVKNEATGANNGLYLVTNPGAAGAAYVLTRDNTMDQAAEFGGGLIAVENKGSTTANTLWLCNNSNSITVGTTAVTFAQLNAATAYTAGNGISIGGNTISANVVASGGLTNSASGLAIDTTLVTKKYVQAIGDGSSTAIGVTHNLGSRDVVCGVYLAASPYSEVDCDVTHDTTTNVTFTFAVAPTVGQYRVVIHG